MDLELPGQGADIGLLADGQFDKCSRHSMRVTSGSGTGTSAASSSAPSPEASTMSPNTRPPCVHSIHRAGEGGL